ncbi:hypothetical protein FDP41_005628 [Naegleria fowleri]|uniref:BRCT domain-containing protein n=1 Tax=Naegleria fowleri TaxID=5763 RepID=A0A6A5BNH5_NAEFO|nr:uncharacterized protein FDP41_005628 [Naegleria fowleri]KAF0975634.1 hypothetical protein FDP41_005628 [Naegleria fowleri]
MSLPSSSSITMIETFNHHQGIFSGLNFVLSISEEISSPNSDSPYSITELIRNEGGKLMNKISNKIHYLIFSNGKAEIYKKALEKHIKIVDTFWVRDCILQRKILLDTEMLNDITPPKLEPVLKRKRVDSSNLPTEKMKKLNSNSTNKHEQKDGHTVRAHDQTKTETTMKKKKKKKINSTLSCIIGCQEMIHFPELGVFNLLGKIDSGAKTSCLDVMNVIHDDVKKILNFDVVLDRNDRNIVQHVTEFPFSNTTKTVISSNGHSSTRYVIQTKVSIGDGSHVRTSCRVHAYGKTQTQLSCVNWEKYFAIRRVFD